MARSSTIVKGDKEVLRMFKEAPDHAYAAMRTAMSKATTPVAKRMRENAKEIEDTGAYARSITKVMRAGAKFKRNGVVLGVVGPRVDYREETTGPGGAVVVRQPDKYAHLVEYGTRHSRALLVQSRAFDTTKDQAINVFVSTVPKALIARMAKDGNRK